MVGDVLVVVAAGVGVGGVGSGGVDDNDVVVMVEGGMWWRLGDVCDGSNDSVFIVVGEEAGDLTGSGICGGAGSHAGDGIWTSEKYGKDGSQQKKGKGKAWKI
jgi:hypothetical protein